MAPCHFFAEQALNILRFLAKKWNIDVEISPAPAQEGQERVTNYNDDFTKARTNSLNFFVPNFEDADFNCSWPEDAGQTHFGNGGGRPGTTVDQGPLPKAESSINNPLFWPFPMQGRPMLPTGDELKEAGFELLV